MNDYSSKSKSFNEKGEYDKTAARFSMILAYDENEIFVRFNRASCYFMLEEPNLVIADCDFILVLSKSARTEELRTDAYKMKNKIEPEDGNEQEVNQASQSYDFVTEPDNKAILEAKPDEQELNETTSNFVSAAKFTRINKRIMSLNALYIKITQTNKYNCRVCEKSDEFVKHEMTVINLFKKRKNNLKYLERKLFKKRYAILNAIVITRNVLTNIS